MMTPELKEKWAAALESGEYEQVKGMLRDNYDRMCCLGVLCHLVDPSKWVRNVERTWEYEAHEGIPSNEFLRMAGLEFGTAEDLATQNDQGVMFREIAKIIRRLPDVA